MSKWGLLRGAGQGVAQAGNMLMADRIDQMKEQRLQKYQEGMQEKQFAREDTLIANANTREDAIRKEDLGIQMQRDSINQANRLLDRDDQLAREAQAQENFETTFAQSKELVSRQLDQLDQQIEIGGIELEQVRGREELRQKILSETDPERQLELMGDYASLANDFNTEPKTITSYGEVDEVTGQQTRVTMQWDAASRSWKPITPGSGQAPAYTDDDIMSDLNGGAPAAAPGSQDNPMPYQQGGGLLRRPSSSELSQELGVGVNPRLSEQIGNVASLPGRAVDRVIQDSAPAYTQWVKGMIEKNKVDQVNFLNRHAYQAALDSGQLNEREAGIVRRLLGERSQ